jgi:hypothetical protein
VDLTERQEGILVAKVQRFEQQWLPRLLSIKEQVDHGERLNSLDLIFLQEVLQDTNNDQRYVSEHAEWQDMAARLIHLYNEITAKALENERKG